MKTLHRLWRWLTLSHPATVQAPPRYTPTMGSNGQAPSIRREEGALTGESQDEWENQL